MDTYAQQELFIKYQEYINNEQKLREKIREKVREIEQTVKEATIHLQSIHSNISTIGIACQEAKKLFFICRRGYEELSKIIPQGQYYRYCDHWSYSTQRLVFLIALTTYLEKELLVTREKVADILGLKTDQKEGFHLEIEDYLMGILQLASELSRFATNSVTHGNYEMPLKVSRFVSDLNSGFRLLNLKNDGLRKRYDALKYDVKKIEEVVYDISIRGLRNPNQSADQSSKT